MVWIRGSEINIIVLKETSVVRKQHRSCGQFLNVVAALLKHIPLVFSIFHRVKSKFVSPHINNNNNALFRFDYQTILQGNKSFLFFSKIFKSCVDFLIYWVFDVMSDVGRSDLFLWFGVRLFTNQINCQLSVLTF